MRGNTAKGKILTENFKGYGGKAKSITYRSSWEYVAFDKMEKLYSMKAIKNWASEESVFIYTSPIDNKEHRYFMDLTVIKNDNEVFYIEIKPFSQTVPPKQGKNKKESTYINEIKTFRVNTAKWNAVREWCKKHTTKDKKYTFLIWTEHDLNV